MQLQTVKQYKQKEYKNQIRQPFKKMATMQALQQENRKQSRQLNWGGGGRGERGSVATMLELHKKLSAWLRILIIETR